MAKMQFPAKKSAKIVAKNKPEKAAKLTKHEASAKPAKAAKGKKMKHPDKVNKLMAMMKAKKKK